MGEIIKCCHFCVAPKRYPGCHGTCPEYLKERAEYDKRKDARDKKDAILKGIYEERTGKVIRANRRKRNRRY